MLNIENLDMLLLDSKQAMSFFNKNQYLEAIEDYYKKLMPMFLSLDAEYINAEDKKAFLDEVAAYLVEKTEEKVNTGKTGNARERILIDANVALVTYELPLILKTGKEYSRELCEIILNKWKEAFPKTNLSMATAEEIDAGFKRKLCFITTAVCDSLGKEDDCRELTLLRNYRDNYMASFAEGRELVAKYYNLAPTIVNHIDKQEDSKEIYKGIYSEYISKCMDLIEEDKKKECMQVYEAMFNDLYGKYFLHKKCGR